MVLAFHVWGGAPPLHSQLSGGREEPQKARKPLLKWGGGWEPYLEGGVSQFIFLLQIFFCKPGSTLFSSF